MVIGFFLALLFLNVYFRVKVLKHYKYLVQNNVEFQAMDIFNKQKINEVVIERYPQHKDSIMAFTENIRKSVNLAIILVALISIASGIMYYYK
jgi:hypothetical protein